MSDYLPTHLQGRLANFDCFMPKRDLIQYAID
jgi:hypothetical protein